MMSTSALTSDPDAEIVSMVNAVSWLVGSNVLRPDTVAPVRSAALHVKGEPVVERYSEDKYITWWVLTYYPPVQEKQIRRIVFHCAANKELVARPMYRSLYHFIVLILIIHVLWCDTRHKNNYFITKVIDKRTEIK